MPYVTFWLPEHDNALRKHLSAKLSYTQAAAAINAEFRTSYSRNAAIGRGQRIGLRSSCPKTAGARKPRAPKPWDDGKISKRTYYRHLKAEQAPKAPQPPTARAIAETFRCVGVNPLNVTLIDLEPGMCRWPSGDGPFVFCGHPQLAGFSYCGPHFALSIGPGSMGEQNAHKVRRAA